MSTFIYQELTLELNRGRTRAILSSGQAVVVHGLAMASKDGDWILREDQETLDHVLSVLDRRGAKYRFGAPLNLRWLRAGWSSHLEFRWKDLRIRTDFVTRPARIAPEDLGELWREQEGKAVAVVDLQRLALIKRTNREKDYPVIGELARKMTSIRDQLLHSRSARDILKLAQQHPDLIEDAKRARPILDQVEAGREALEIALDAERRRFIRENELTLDCYIDAARGWAKQWSLLAPRIERLPLLDAHTMIVNAAKQHLPEQVVNIR